MTVPSTDSELDSGPRGRERERLCVATRTVRPVSDLIRFVVSPDGEAVPDLKCKLPGRGVWVTATQAVLDEAIKRNVFARGFKRNVRVAADLLVRTERLLEQSVLDALAIAGKAGLVAAGFTKVEVALSHERVATILHAAEASADGVRKLDAARRRSQGGPVPVIEVLTSAQLDLALGRSNVIHAALLAGAPSDTLLARLRRLERYRTGDLGQNGSGRAGRADPGEPAATVGGYGTG
jgi:predicted RNA-binding protein YlxR (DUF448 family)